MYQLYPGNAPISPCNLLAISTPVTPPESPDKAPKITWKRPSKASKARGIIRALLPLMLVLHLLCTAIYPRKHPFSVPYLTRRTHLQHTGKAPEIHWGNNYLSSRANLQMSTSTDIVTAVLQGLRAWRRDEGDHSVQDHLIACSGDRLLTFML